MIPSVSMRISRICNVLCSHFDHKLVFDLTTSLSGMAPKVKLTAALFNERYGNIVSEHFAQHTTAYTLRIALSQRKPPIIVTDGMLKLWFAKFRLPSDAVTVSSAEELHRRYGDVLPALAAHNPTAYRLMKVLQARTPPLYVSEEVLKQWLRRYSIGMSLRLIYVILRRFSYFLFM